MLTFQHKTLSLLPRFLLSHTKPPPSPISSFPIPQSSRRLRPQTPQSPPLLHSPITPAPPSSPHHTESQPRAAVQSPLLVFSGRTTRRCVDSAPGMRIDLRQQCGGGLGFRRGKDSIGGRWWPLL
ncbi:hypothetical protein Droror1_Dr00000278, partial [Drosera rotundifolia]